MESIPGKARKNKIAVPTTCRVSKMKTIPNSTTPGLLKVFMNTILQLLMRVNSSGARKQKNIDQTQPTFSVVDASTVALEPEHN